MNEVSMCKSIKWPRREYEILSAETATTVSDGSGRQLLQFASTQYLGMLWDKEFIKEAKRLTAEPSLLTGSIGSPFLGGLSVVARALAVRVAELAGTQEALAFGSGWIANYSVCRCLSEACDVILSDRRNHNSVIEGLTNSKRQVIVVDVHDSDLRVMIEKLRSKRVGLIFTTITGLSGEQSQVPLWLKDYDNVLTVADEAHSFGAVGQTGCEFPGFFTPDVRVVGFSKALGTGGAAVGASGEFIDLLKQTAFPWMFSTTPPPFLWVLARAALEVALKRTDERRKILEMAKSFRHRAACLGFQVGGDRHISCIHFSSDAAAVTLEQKLRDLGLYVKASLSPSRPPGKPTVRICFTPKHDESDMARLCEGLATVGALAI